MRASPFAEPAMAGIDIQHKHSLSLAKARKGVEDMARKLADKFGLEYGWDGDEMHFNRSGLDGSIAVTHEPFPVTAHPGFLPSAPPATVAPAIRTLQEANMSQDPRTIARDREARFPAVRAAGHGGAGNPQGAGREVFLGLAKTRPQPFARRREKGFGQHVGSRQELAAVAPPTRTSPSASRQPKGSACPANSRFDALRSACSISPTNASASPSSSNAATPRDRKSTRLNSSH